MRFRKMFVSHHGQRQAGERTSRKVRTITSRRTSKELATTAASIMPYAIAIALVVPDPAAAALLADDAASEGSVTGGPL